MEDITLNEIRKEGIKALVEKLGPVGMIKFLQQFDKGSGDYTKERQQWKHSITRDEVVTAIKKKKND